MACISLEPGGDWQQHMTFPIAFDGKWGAHTDRNKPGIAQATKRPHVNNEKTKFQHMKFKVFGFVEGSNFLQEFGCKNKARIQLGIDDPKNVARAHFLFEMGAIPHAVEKYLAAQTGGFVYSTVIANFKPFQVKKCFYYF